MADESPTPLEFAQTKDLLDEIRRRFDDVLFVGYQEKTNTLSDYVLFLQGSHHGVLGLLSMAKMASERVVHDDTSN